MVTVDHFEERLRLNLFKELVKFRCQNKHRAKKLYLRQKRARGLLESIEVLFEPSLFDVPSEFEAAFAREFAQLVYYMGGERMVDSSSWDKWMERSFPHGEFA